MNQECPHYEMKWFEVGGKMVQRRTYVGHVDCVSERANGANVSDFARRWGIPRPGRRKAAPASLLTHIQVPDRSRQATGHHAAAWKRVPRTAKAIRAEMSAA